MKTKLITHKISFLKNDYKKGGGEECKDNLFTISPKQEYNKLQEKQEL